MSLHNHSRHPTASLPYPEHPGLRPLKNDVEERREECASWMESLSMSLDESNDIVSPVADIWASSLAQYIRFSGSNDTKIVLPHSLTRWTPEDHMNALLGAQCTEHALEQHMQLIDRKLDKWAPHREQFFTVPLQDRLLECKLRRAQVEVHLYSQAIARGTRLRAAKYASSSSEGQSQNDYEIGQETSSDGSVEMSTSSDEDKSEESSDDEIF